MTSYRRSPRSLAPALDTLRDAVAPATVLAQIETWSQSNSARAA